MSTTRIAVTTEMADELDRIFALSREQRVVEFERLREEDPILLSAVASYVGTCNHRDEITAERCGAKNFEQLPVCLTHIRHAPIKDTHDSLAARRLETAARLTKMTEDAVTVLDDIIKDPLSQPQVKLKAAIEVFDRGGIPRHNTSSIDHNITAEVTVHDPSATVKAKLDRLREGMEADALRGIATASHADDIADAHVVDEDDGTAA